MIVRRRKNPRGEEGERTRQEILRVALDLFARQGFTKTTISQIAQQADTYRSSVDWHFGSKDGLLLAVMEYYLEHLLPDQIEAMWNEYMSGHPQAQPSDLVIDFFIVAVEKIISENLGLVIALFTLTFEEIHHYPELAKKITLFWNKLTAALENGIRLGQDLGQFPAEINPGRTAKSILALAQGLFMQWYMEPDKVNPEEFFHIITETSLTLLKVKK